MRPRSKSELLSPERLARLQMALHPTATPKVIRNYIRNHYVVNAIDELYAMGMGEEVDLLRDKNGKPIFEEVEVVDAEGVAVLDPETQQPKTRMMPVMIPAPISTRKEALVAVINFATIGASVHMLGDDNEAMQGAIALPELELRHQQRRLSPTGGAGLPTGANLGEGGGVVSDEYTIDLPKPTNGNGNHASNGNGNGNGHHE